ncbi:MAG: bifunctional (p)ppGpp synthetase/guanosine-3',5'-bis(diphosphate) 3'-pyrophosphohydrolase [Defluviitaleaceae bacterium]|nr:bifunctional (p)ppGpp synthetase/guanosine-3',5'-bis(diphosphate) 3'-pyrophosphohydrolase [Defluviitaleaceae bacterium]MCL2835697.1 bifunctional (p)ppGpp synthetase/guanosine-3',5'-bis(diphosphate) 3'-pyrophosphohydrolase [Defluviitaleaceae bacterium]
MADESANGGRLDPCPDEIFGMIMDNMKKYHPSHDFGIVERAYELAGKAHDGQLRASGEPYIVHPLEVARILTTIEMDRDTIAAAILHDVIEDTKYNYEDIEKAFNNEIAMLVEGVTQLDKVNYQGGHRDPWQAEVDKQADNYRKMFLAMSNDIRVVIIKIADRLHNLRTIKHMPPSHKKKKADETMDIYAPLANRLGISKLRYELEDLAFHYQDPEAYEDLKDKIQFKQNERLEYVQNLVSSIEEKLNENNIEAKVVGRPKQFFSIYRKMMQKGKSLDEIYDLYAVRIIVNSIGECYHALGVAHLMYTPVPERFKDYVAMPKPNRYQSIHNTLIGPGGEPFELQIRTAEMDRVSEYGVAAHWKYKNGGSGTEDDDVKLNWLRQMMEWSRDLSESSEFLNELKSDLSPYKASVYCFTPKGRVVELMAGATPIDFAYTIHSAVGNRMVGAKINNKIATLNTELQTGDQVEILTSQNSKGPSRDWLKICKTSQSRAKINAWFKKHNREENMAKGKELLEIGAKKKGVALAELTESKYVSVVLNRYSYNDWDTLCASVGHGGISEGQVINRLYDEYMRDKSTASDKDEQIIQLINESQKKTDGKASGKGGISIKGDTSMSVRLSHCCSPMPGDEIVGFITRGKGVSIHRSDCVNVINLDEVSRHRVTPVEWNLSEDGGAQIFDVSVDIITINRPGVVSDISRLFMNDNINMDSINTYKQKNDVLIRVTFPIGGKAQLEKIMAKLGALSGIYEVKRTIT